MKISEEEVDCFIPYTFKFHQEEQRGNDLPIEATVGLDVHVCLILLFIDAGRR